MPRVEWVEQIIMIGAIAALWPFILGYREPWYQWGALTLVALGMLTITVRKWRRMNSAFEEAKEIFPGGGSDEPILKMTPPGKPKGKESGDSSE